MMISLLCV